MFETETQTAEYPQGQWEQGRRPQGQYPRRSQDVRLPGMLPRFGQPPAPSPDLILDDFDFGRADLKQSHKNKIDQLAQQIVDSWKPASTRPALGVRAVGHTDKVGPIEYNLDLGTRRAEKVMGRLTGLIGGGDIDTYQRMTWSRTSVGKAQPRSLSVPAQNRRVEIFVEWGRVKPPLAPPPPLPPRPPMRSGLHRRETPMPRPHTVPSYVPDGRVGLHSEVPLTGNDGDRSGGSPEGPENRCRAS